LILASPTEHLATHISKMTTVEVSLAVFASENVYKN
jgi:hypothetical protein